MSDGFFTVGAGGTAFVHGPRAVPAFPRNEALDAHVVEAFDFKEYADIEPLLLAGAHPLAESSGKSTLELALGDRILQTFLRDNRSVQEGLVLARLQQNAARVAQLTQIGVRLPDLGSTSEANARFIDNARTDPMARNNGGMTLLMWAARYDFPEVAAHILDHLVPLGLVPRVLDAIDLNGQNAHAFARFAGADRTRALLERRGVNTTPYQYPFESDPGMWE